MSLLKKKIGGNNLVDTVGEKLAADRQIWMLFPAK